MQVLSLANPSVTTLILCELAPSILTFAKLSIQMLIFTNLSVPALSFAGLLLHPYIYQIEHLCAQFG